jgi:DNA-directed RNA polymerase specialized sigma subunit
MSNKSKIYQHKIVEISFDQSKLSNFSTERGINYILTENEMSDKILELRTALIEQLYDVINGEMLTEHQKKILFMRLMGKTQNEISSHLGITQSAVHKSLHGNIDYRNNKKRYGGIIKKLKKICNGSHEIQNLLKQISDVKCESEE